MNGWAVVYSACWCCHLQFGFNPHLVPSIRIDGVREPTCRSCIETANIHRKAAGLDQLVVLPGAYEPIREEEL